MKYPNTPELIASVDEIDNKGNDTFLGDKIVGIGVRQDKEVNREGTVDIDVRGFKRGSNLVIRLPLPELMGDRNRYAQRRTGLTP